MPVTLPFGPQTEKNSVAVSWNPNAYYSAAAAASKKNKQNRLQQALAELERARFENQLSTSQALQFQKRALPEIDKAFAGAGANIALGAGTAKDRIAQAGMQNLSIGKQSLAGRGLGNTSLSTALNRGVSADTNTQMSAIDEAVAQRMAQLTLGKQQARQGVYGGIGDLLQNYGVSNANILQGKAATLGNVQQRRRRGLASFLGSVAPIIGAVWPGAGAGLSIGNMPNDQG